MRNYENAAVQLRRMMQTQQLDTAALSEKTGISPSVLRGILSGRNRSVSTRNMVALAQCFGLSAAELIDLFS